MLSNILPIVAIILGWPAVMASIILVFAGIVRSSLAVARSRKALALTMATRFIGLAGFLVSVVLSL